LPDTAQVGAATPYRYLEHTADAGIEATGATLAEAFAAAADGLAGWLCDARTVAERDTREFAVSAADMESLLVDWLNEVNFAFEVEHFAFRRFEVKEFVELELANGGGPAGQADTSRAGASLRAVGYGEPLDPARHHPGEQVKSVTYHGVRIGKTADGWLVRVFLDI
jgi:SHS2 domain-containing protein